jgi:signal transduction histidine kinase/FtsH-binding integral membrane protein
MNSVISTVNLISIFIYVALLVFAQIRGQQMRGGRNWLSLTILLLLLATASLFLPALLPYNEAYVLSRSFFTALLMMTALAAFGALVLRDLNRRTSRLWLVLSGVWLASMGITAIVTQPVTVGQPEWLLNTLTAPSVASLVTLVGLGLLSALLLGASFYGFYAAQLPEIANRALFWVLDTALVMMGVVLVVSATDVLVLIGLLMLMLATIGAVYAQVTHRVFDIRSELGATLRTMLQLVVISAIIYGVITLANTIETSVEQRTVIYVTLAVTAALIYVPIRQLVEVIVRGLTQNYRTDLAEAARRYSQEVSKAAELDQIVDVATNTVNQLMRLRRSGLILVDTVKGTDQVELIMIWSSGERMERPHFISRLSPVYQRLGTEHASLLQFDIEFNQKYAGLSDEERRWWKSLHLSAYAPVIVDETLIGILAGGARMNDAPYYPRDMELLVTMANQTGVALRNARLVADLRQLNQNMSSLNTGLEAAKDQMERLDSVKTDFVTIASHELRTPLAQIRGYTDIIDALNEQGMLDKDQTVGLVANLRKATERMEELIAAMLDVSQIDVDAMDLRFAQSSLESVMRMAIEPLADAVKQRKLTLSARGLRGLPTIQADVQRLVQAFRNIVLNAIKFTPDGGRIEITADLKKAERPGEQDHILVLITDSGVGIAKENLELIFQKFYRAYDPSLHSTGSHKFMGAGPGLGLTIAKGVVEGHGGKIWAESAGHNMEALPGAVFYIRLPLQPPEDARRVMPFEGKSSEDGDQQTSAEPTLVRSQLP